MIEVWIEGQFDVTNNFSGQSITLFISRGMRYEGEWKNDSRTGYGKMIYKNGIIYEGEWKNNQKSGIGKEIDTK
jgi:radial spoke head protein 1